MRYFLAASLIVSLVSVTGCEPKPAPQDSHGHGHDHAHDHGHDHAEKKESYPSKAAELTAVLGKTIDATQAIADAAAKGTPDDAHDQLHDIGHLLESLPAISKEAGTDAAFQESLESATKSLFEAIGKIDESLHDSSKEFKYDDVKETIANGVTALKDLVQKAPK